MFNPFRQRIMVTAVLKNGKKFLLLHRKKLGIQGGKWQLPEGGLHFAETPEQALIREMREETGLSLREARLLGVHTSTMSELGKPLYHVIRLFYSCKAAGKIRLSRDHPEFIWVTREGIRKLKLFEGLRWGEIKKFLR
ncbi:MAG: NUDIX hydrolase [Candidatus Aenigmarchaeota archaeon]|nr:NUDIX hydrolase [Candidatus Aenigmarchaeota archaeon]